MRKDSFSPKIYVCRVAESCRRFSRSTGCWITLCCYISREKRVELLMNLFKYVQCFARVWIKQIRNFDSRQNQTWLFLRFHNLNQLRPTKLTREIKNLNSSLVPMHLLPVPYFSGVERRGCRTLIFDIRGSGTITTGMP